ncbi:Siderophore iron transporter mirB [Fusarium oxysporum f. sp. cepae]|nr:Siderophore iron transporter mirB [Fusarium oxysporum f. sp. cepae]RKK64034.1 Siderophore iron transporter mirB [Fusarium oxysporum f. sp. cepae]
MATHTMNGPEPVNDVSVPDIEKAPANNNIMVDEDLKDFSDDEFKQQGVKKAEAITSVWTKKMLIATFVFLFLVSFVDSLLQNVQSNLIPYVTSAFASHGLLASTGIVASILGAVWNLTLAKIIDIWGRVWGFGAMVLLIVVGMIMKATCNSVEMYAAAHTFYWVGHLGLIYVIDVVVADTTTLRNRLIIMGINYTPTISSTFAGPKIAELFLKNVNFRWAFGSFCIILLAFCIPVMVIFIMNEMKAKKFGLAPEKVHNRTIWESFKYYFVQFDVIGLFLTSAGWALLLLPFSIAATAPNGWATGYIIAMPILGVVLIASFVVWEKFFAPVPYFPFHLLADRTILGACLIYGIMLASIFCWDTYYGSYLQVVHFESVTTSGYILNSFSLMAAFVGPFVGIAIRYLGRFKWPSFVGVPFLVLGTALLIHFRHPETAVNWLVMCQLFNGIYSGIWSLTARIAVMSSVKHQDVAVALAIWGMFGGIGSSIGVAIAGGIWTNMLPTELAKQLPESAKNMTATIYGDINVQLSYPAGSPERDAIIAAYDFVQKKMIYAGCAFIPLCVICLFMWRNIDIKEKDAQSKQAKGMVF